MIYFAQMEIDGALTGPIKIGFTRKSLWLKIRQLSHACPYPLKFIGTCAGEAPEEKGLHRKFRALRLRGEWFKPEPELRDFIEAHAQPVFEWPEDCADHDEQLAVA